MFDTSIEKSNNRYEEKEWSLYPNRQWRNDSLNKNKSVYLLSRYRCTHYVGNNIAKVIDHFPRLRLKLLEEYPSRDYKNGAKDYARLNGFRGPANSPLDCWFLPFFFFFLSNRYFLLKFYNLAPRDIKHRTSIQDSLYIKFHRYFCRCTCDRKIRIRANC